MSRSLAEQTEAELGGTLSILTRQKRDHVKLDRLLEQLGESTGEAEDVVLARICRLVFSHAFAEEAVLWPALRRILPDGEELTTRIEQEHQAINALVSEVESIEPGDLGREALIARAVTLLRQDVRDEEDVALPRLQAVADVRPLRRLGVAWEAVRRTAPTRAHPVVARRPPGNVLSAMPLSVVDRTRDLLDVGVRRFPDRAKPALRTASQGLGRVAHRIEQLPPLRKGERPETRAE